MILSGKHNQQSFIKVFVIDPIKLDQRIRKTSMRIKLTPDKNVLFKYRYLFFKINKNSIGIIIIPI